jgi:3-hydroxy-9,10-secoandrosta-1,3,5(10)-triene-9,17-dione monooxygenase
MIIHKHAPTSTAMTYDKAISLARELAPAIAQRAEDAEAERCLPEETIQEIIDAGLIRLLVPARWGGHELSFAAHVDSTIEIAKADASTGWCYSFFVMHNWMLAQFSEQAQRDVWGTNPDALITTSFVPVNPSGVTETSGGYILNGSWPWSSGVDHSDWCILGGLLHTTNAPPELALFLLPRSDYEVLDTWFVSGLKASGSKNVLAKDAFVPAHRVVRLTDIRDGRQHEATEQSGSLYDRPFFTASAPGFVAPILGATIGAYETWRETSRKKFTAFTGEQVASFSHARIRLAEVEAVIQTARMFLQECLEVIAPGHLLNLEERFRCSRNVAYIAKCCVWAIECIFLASGGSANYQTNPLQRYWRDIHAMAAHAGLNFDNAGEQFGRSELDLPPNPRIAFF